jgi:hypothetical protein
MLLCKLNRPSFLLKQPYSGLRRLFVLKSEEGRKKVAVDRLSKSNSLELDTRQLKKVILAFSRANQLKAIFIASFITHCQ